MLENEPTYKEYLTAKRYNRFKYKYGIFVLILCWIFLLFLCYFVYLYGEELSSNPFIYGSRKANIDCFCTCTNSINEMFFLEINSTSLVINGGKKGDIDDINWSDVDWID